MDIYLVFKDGKHGFLLCPSEHDLENAVILDKRLNIAPNQEILAKLNMLEPAALDMIKMSKESPCPLLRVVVFAKMIDAFYCHVPAFVKINWDLWRVFGIEYLMSTCQETSK